MDTEAKLARLNRMVRWHPRWSPHLDVVSMAALGLLIVVGLLAPWLNGPLRSKSPGVMLIVGGVVLILAIQVANDIRLHRRALRLLAKKPGLTSIQLMSNRQFRYWVAMHRVKADNPYELALALIKFQSWQYRWELATLTLVVALVNVLAPFKLQYFANTLKKQ